MDSRQEHPLAGRRVAMLVTDGFSQAEYARPREFLERHGAHVTLVAPKPVGSRVQAYERSVPSATHRVELDVRHARVEDFDMLVVPGGVASPDRLRLVHEAIAFIRGFAHASKPIAAICHGPWPLIDAGIVRGRHVTSWPSLRMDLQNAGARWSDLPVVVDGSLVTSRKMEDLDVFERAILDTLAIGAPSGATR